MDRPSDSELLAAGGSDAELLKRFMKEFFPYSEFRKANVFTKEMRNDFYWQSHVICRLMGLNIIYEYGKEEIRYHASYAEGKRPPGTPFVEVIPSIYE